VKTIEQSILLHYCYSFIPIVLFIYTSDYAPVKKGLTKPKNIDGRAAIL